MNRAFVHAIREGKTQRPDAEKALGRPRTLSPGEKLELECRLQAPRRAKATESIRGSTVGERVSLPLGKSVPQKFGILSPSAPEGAFHQPQSPD